MAIGAYKESYLLRRFGLTGAIIVAACLATGATFLGYGVDANLPWPVTSNTTIAAKYCGGTVLAGTGSTGQFILTLPVVTGFPSNCSVLIKNGDGASGKILSGFPADLNAKLYPKQSVGVKIVNGTWQSFYNPGPWTPTPGSFTFFASPTGNDSNDCLSASTACTLPGICSARKTVNQPGPVGISLNAGTYSALDADNEMCGVFADKGGSGAALLVITGDCTTPANVVLAVPANSNGIVVKDGGLVAISCVTITGGNGSNGIQAAGQMSVADLDKIVWGTWGTGGVHVSAASGAYVNLAANGETITGNFTSGFHWILSGNAVLFAGGPTNISSAVSWTGGSFLTATGNPYINLSGWSVTGSGVAGSTGQRANLTGPGYLATTAATPCNSFFPGNGACVIQFGFQDNANEPLTSPIPAGNLPTPTASTLGGIESIAATAHQWIDSISTSGVPHQSQPAFSDLSGAATNAQIPVGGAGTIKGSLNGTAEVDLTEAQAASVVGVAMMRQTITVNFGVTGDNAIPIVLWPGDTEIQFNRVLISQCGGSLSGAAFGMNTAPSGAGAQILPSGTAATLTSSAANTNNNMQQLVSFNNAGSEAYTPSSGQVQFNVGTAVATNPTNCKVTAEYFSVP